MKKIIILLLLIFTLVSCSNGCETVECIEAQAKLEEQRAATKAAELEAQRKHNLELKKIEAEIEANKPVEVRVQESANEVQREANESLEYLENSQKVRDFIEGAAVGYGVYKIFVE